MAPSPRFDAHKVSAGQGLTTCISRGRKHITFLQLNELVPIHFYSLSQSVAMKLHEQVSGTESADRVKEPY